MHGLIVHEYGDAEHQFRLTLDGIKEIEEKFDKSIFVIVAGLQMRTAKSVEIFEVVRVGLIGGGMKPVEALRLVNRYGDQRPLTESLVVAHAIGLAGLARIHSKELEEALGEPEGPTEGNQSASTSAPSSDQQP